MHSLLSRTAVVNVPDVERPFDMFEIRRDTTRNQFLLYIVVFKQDVQEKLRSKERESFFIDPIAEVVIRNNNYVFSKRPNWNYCALHNTYESLCNKLDKIAPSDGDIKKFEDYLFDVIRKDSHRECQAVIR
jgi:hypothetical protein